MGDQKHGEKINETKAVQPKQEEEQQPVKNPADALSRLKANMAGPGDIETLQNAVGNRAVRRLMTKQSQSRSPQRHVPPETDEAYKIGFPGMQGSFKETKAQLGQLKTTADELKESTKSTIIHHNTVLTAAYASGAYACENNCEGQESGGETQSPQAGENTPDGGGGSQSPQGGEDIYEGGGESQSPQGGEDIYEGD